MAVYSGFFNSVVGESGIPDRKYDAEDFGKIFDGVIRDGVFESVGNCFEVNAVPNTMEITVGPGKAWLNHAWLTNDADIKFKIAAADDLLNRYDSVVLTIDNTTSVRAGTLTVIKGTPATKPSLPAITNNNSKKQYRIANIYIAAAVKNISNANIEYLVGTSATPYVTGPLEIVGSDAHWAKWASELSQFTTSKETEFNTWFASLKESLSGDVAAKLQTRIDTLENKLKKAIEIVSFDTNTKTLVTRTMQ